MTDAIQPYREDETPELDLVAITKFRNLILHRLMPPGTVASVCRKIGVSGSEIGKYINLRKCPLRNDPKTGTLEYRVAAQRLATYLKVAPEVLFPQGLYELRLPNKVEREYNSKMILPILEARRENRAIEPDYDKDGLTEAVSGILKDLTPREQMVMRWRFGLDGDSPATLKDISRLLGVTQETARQIEGKALRKLRRPDRSDQLAPFLFSQPARDPGMRRVVAEIQPLPIKKMLCERIAQFHSTLITTLIPEFIAEREKSLSPWENLSWSPYVEAFLLGRNCIIVYDLFNFTGEEPKSIHWFRDDFFGYLLSKIKAETERLAG